MLGNYTLLKGKSWLFNVLKDTALCLHYVYVALQLSLQLLDSNISESIIDRTNLSIFLSIQY